MWDESWLCVKIETVVDLCQAGYDSGCFNNGELGAPNEEIQDEELVQKYNTDNELELQGNGPTTTQIGGSETNHGASAVDRRRRLASRRRLENRPIHRLLREIRRA